MFGYQILKLVYPRPIDVPGKFLWNENYDYQDTLYTLEKKLNPKIRSLIKDKIVIDFGCGFGEAAVCLAKSGAKKVYGIDIRDYPLACASELAREEKADAEFTMQAPEAADLVVSIDAFEHFSEPEEMLKLMKKLLVPDGVICMSFGPTWFHPMGGHLFSVFPWAHLLFSEESLIKWRSDFKRDGAKKFYEVEGGLNQMTIKRFESLVKKSGLKIKSMECVPIKALKWLAKWPMTREFTTSLIRCELQAHSF
jgi:SAM-dependent methyltransferase